MKRILLAICACFFCFNTNAIVEGNPTINSQLEHISWVRTPRISYKNNELQGYDRTVSVSLGADEKGLITFVRIDKSSGLDYIDQKVLMGVKLARLKPYQVNGVYHPVAVTQSFTLMVSREAEYQTYPIISIKESDLRGRNRVVVIYAEADNAGNVTKAEIKESSGLAELDEYVLSEYRKQAKFVPLMINGQSYPITKTSSFSFSK